jgi:hypothetical protein
MILANILILSKSDLRIISAKAGLSIIRQRDVLSTLNKIAELISKTLSLIYTRNKSCPNIDPSLTPSFLLNSKGDEEHTRINNSFVRLFVSFYAFFYQYFTHIGG